VLLCKRRASRIVKIALGASSSIPIVCRKDVFFLRFGAICFRARVGTGRFGGVDEGAKLAGEGGCGVGGDCLVAFHALRALETVEGGIFGRCHSLERGPKEVAYVESIEWRRPDLGRPSRLGERLLCCFLRHCCGETSASLRAVQPYNTRTRSDVTLVSCA
jgi:hypothetical protein